MHASLGPRLRRRTALARATVLGGKFGPRVRAPRSKEPCVSYLIAAYGIVIAALALYGLRVQAQRRAQLRRAALSRED